MANGVSPMLTSTDLGSAIRDGDWTRARRLMAIRLGEAFDQTDSARDLKAISMSLAPLMAQCEIDDQRKAASSNTPLASIMAEADEQGF